MKRNTAKNDITGDSLTSKTSKAYRDNYDAIFSTKEQKPEYKKCEKCGQYWETDTPGNNHNCPCPEDALQ